MSGGIDLRAEKDLRVLLIEDRDDDAVLLRFHLERAGYRLEMSRVQTLEMLEESLGERWDLIISDYNLPGFDALDALEMVRQRGCETPFLVTSGQVSEDVAVAAMRAGAQDYFSKQNLARLVPAIERSLVEQSVRVERRIAEDALRTSEERLRLAQAAAHLVTWDWDIPGGTIAWSGRCDLLYGRAAEELSDASSIVRFVHPEDKQSMQSTIRAAIASQGDFVDEFRLVWPDGSIHWISAFGRVQYSEAGTPDRMIGINQDITARKQSEEVRHRLAAIVESSDDAVISLSLEGVITSWNAGAERVFGYGPDEVLGNHITMLIPDGRHTEEDHILERIRRGERVGHFDTVRRTSTGRHIDVSLTVSPIRDERGHVVGASKVARDITRHKQAEEALRKSEKLAAAGRLAASISHEINNPLEAVTNLVYLVSTADELGPTTREYVELAQKELQRVSHIVSHTLRFHRQSTGPTSVSLPDVINSVLVLYEGRLRTLGITVERDYSAVAPIVAYEGELRQVFANFIGNALDAMLNTEARRLLIRTRPRMERGKEVIRVLIADTGIGMSVETKSHLFEPFFSTKGINGTGLGLWLSKDILDRHHATLSIRSREERGSVFLIDLPLPSAEVPTSVKGQSSYEPAVA